MSIWTTAGELIEKMTLDRSELTFLDGRTFCVRDLWAGKDLGDTATPFVGELNLA